MRPTGFLSKLLFGAALALPMTLTLPQASAAIFVSVNIAPPALPVTTQPLCPGAGYLWTPGYWAYGAEGYFWVPGVWVQPPAAGLLWTPAWWGFENSAYVFHPGYWGPHVGFYGGINYGFGYTGVGFSGGEWRGGSFFYNSAVANIDLDHVSTVYSRNIAIVNHSTTAFNGGRGGIQSHPNSFELAAVHEQHLQPSASQLSHESFAAQNRTYSTSFNHARPALFPAASLSALHEHPASSAFGTRLSPDRQPADREQTIASRQTYRETRNPDASQR